MLLGSSARRRQLARKHCAALPLTGYSEGAGQDCCRLGLHEAGICEQGALSGIVLGLCRSAGHTRQALCSCAQTRRWREREGTVRALLGSLNSETIEIYHEAASSVKIAYG